MIESGCSQVISFFNKFESFSHPRAETSSLATLTHINHNSRSAMTSQLRSVFSISCPEEDRLPALTSLSLGQQYDLLSFLFME
ncbi:hypothetical protein QTP88_006953 [Uroleucon formosanum]